MRNALGVLLAMGACGAANAQSPDDIVVVGERRSEPLSRLASNVAILGQGQLKELGPQTATEALNRLPGVNFQRGSGVESLPAIRSPVLNGGQGAGSILLLEDGVPIRAAGFANVNQAYEANFDFAERVEVVRGPGSAAYGSNAVHGLINVETIRTHDHYKGGRSEWDLSAGQFGRLHTKVLMAKTARSEAFRTKQEQGCLDEDIICLTSPTGGYVALSARSNDGWRDESGEDEWRLLIKGQTRGVNRLLAAGGTLSLIDLRQETAGFIEGELAYRDRALARQNPNPEAFRDSRIARLQGALSFDLNPKADLTLRPFVRTIETDLLLHFFPSKALEETRQSGFGLLSQLNWRAHETLDLQFGFDIDRTIGALREEQTIPTIGSFPQGLHYDYSVEAVQTGLFAQGNWELRKGLRLVAGLRGEMVRYDYDNRAPDGDFGRFRRAPDRTDSFDALTPKLGLVWSDEDARAWANFSRGARPPQTTDLYLLQTQQVPGEQGSEIIDSFEVGYGREGTRGGLEIAAYSMDKRDGAFRNADGLTITNAKTRHQGVEFSGNYELSEHWALWGAVTYGRHTYRFDDRVRSASDIIRNGALIDTAPEWFGSLNILYMPVDWAYSIVSYTYMGEYFTDAANTRSYPGHVVVDLRLGFRLGGNINLQADVRNLFDQTYAERADFAFGTDRYFPGEPRNVTLRLSVRR